MSRRRFAQLFREQVGMTPKRYCRLHRFHNVTRQICAGEAVEVGTEHDGLIYYARGYHRVIYEG